MNQLEALAELKRRIDHYCKLYKYRPYGHPDTLCPDGKLWQEMHAKGKWQQWSNKPFQLEFHDLGRENSYRLLLAANGVGKTEPACAETAMHLTGKYPKWWTGHRFDHPVKWWACGISNSTQKDALQPGLLGPDLQEGLGMGYIPRDKIVGKPTTRQAGIADVCDTVRIQHETNGKKDGVSHLAFKVYQMGWRAFQAGVPDGVTLDEQPNEYNADEKGIYSEIQTRLFRSGGIFMGALTPLLGETPMIERFLKAETPGITWIGATWDDAPHLLDDEKERLKAEYPAHEVEARTRGVPMRGEGAVWPIPESEIVCAPFDIPPHWARIKGLDFGIGHPAAGAYCAWDRDADVWYVIATYRRANATPAEHAAWFNHRDPWVPVSWPHDGTNREKSSGLELQRVYRNPPYSVNLLGKSARYPKAVGEVKERAGAQPVEPIVQEIYECMLTGRFKVFVPCHEFFDEFRAYHRKDGRIVDRRDDVLKAVMYARMMKRYAVASFVAKPRRAAPQQPAFSARL